MPPPVLLGFVPNLFSVACYAALSQGFFSEAGLDVWVAEFPNGSQAAKALEQGELDCTVGGHLQTISAVERGSDQIFIAPLAFEESPDHSCISLLGRRGGPRSTLELEGARIAASAVGAISELQLRVVMDRAGGDYESLQLVAMPFSEMAQALLNGRVDAASVVEPFVSEFLADGTAVLLDRGSLSQVPNPGQRIMITGLVTRRTWLTANQELARTLTGAIRRGVEFVRANERSTRKMIADYTGIGQRSADAMTLPAFHRFLAPGDLQLVLDLAAKFGMIGHTMEAGELLDATSAQQEESAGLDAAPKRP